MEPNKAKDKIIVALDVSSLDEAKALVQELAPHVGAFKIGKELFTAEGPKAFEYVHEQGAKIFYDSKFNDIPNTVAQAGTVAAKHGIWLFNIHCLGGKAMLKETVDRVASFSREQGIRKPLIIGVTVLTSINEDMLKNELLVNEPLADYAVHLAKMAKDAGLDGVICSPKETRVIKEACGKDFLCITPGIRPKWASKDDQQRITTPSEAIKDGADYLVIGRAITGQEDRVGAVQRIVEEIEGV